MTVHPYPPTKKSAKHPRGNNPLFLLGVVLLVLGLSILASSDFWEKFLNDPNLDPEVVEAAKREADEITKRHQNWVQYKLVALTTEQRPCIKCPNGITMVTVKAGEVYKYGITTQGNKRYSSTQYQHLKLTFIEELKGDYTKCKKMEIHKILSYQFLPESNKLEIKLTRPPGNANKS